MCETRREVRSLRPKPSGDKKVAKARGPGPRDDAMDASTSESAEIDSASEAVAEEGA